MNQIKNTFLIVVPFLFIACGSEKSSDNFTISTLLSEYNVVEGMKKDVKVQSDREGITFKILDKSQAMQTVINKNSGILVYRAPENINGTEDIKVIGIDANGKQSDPLTLTFKTVSKDIQPSTKILKTGADDGGFGEDRLFVQDLEGDIVDFFGNTWAENSDTKLSEVKSYLSASIKCEVLGLKQGKNFRLPTMNEALNLIDYSKVSGTGMIDDAFLNRTLAFTWVDSKNDKNMVVSFDNALVANIDSFSVGQNYTSRCIDSLKSTNEHIVSTDRYSGYTFDFSTGLKWSPIIERRPIASDNNETASEYCADKHSGRVPNINELRSVIEDSGVSTFITNGATILISSTPFNDINISARKSNYAMYLREDGTIGFGREYNELQNGITCVSNF